MHTFLLVTHIITMILSLGLMVAATAMLLAGRVSSVKIATAGWIATLAGSITGFVLLLSAPLSMNCVTLGIYLIGVSLAYRYVFGMGNARLARVRSRI